MPIEFYTLDLSAPCRGVWMTLEALEVKYKKNVVDIFKNEQKTAAFAAISPKQTIPGLKDGQVALGESKAIGAYLCNEYGAKKGKAKLYPAGAKARARVDMILYMTDSFNDGLMSYINLRGVLMKGEKMKSENIGKVHDILALCEKFLSQTRYIATDDLTIADFFAYAFIGILQVTGFDDYAKYPKLVAWKKALSQLPYHKKTVEEPLAQLTAMYKSKLPQESTGF